MKTIRYIFHVFLISLIATVVSAQTESELKEDADILFEKEQYVDATSYYLRLLALTPKDADYNFRYGTCLLFNSYQKKDAIRYLNYSVNDKNIDPRAFYFYGKALHLNYQFNDAIKYYKIYLSKRAKRDNRYRVEREIEMCENGKKLLTTFTDIIVSEKREIAKEKFYQLYRNMETVGGDILVSENFQSKIDKKKGHIPIVHYPNDAKAVYYSSYGEKGDSGKDIYTRRRLPNGKWGNAQLLPGAVNTMEDEDFPFMHSNGDFLFFSSKGHNSMGGYDVFMSRFDPNTNSFKKPENVDFAISSPDDDLFYVVDETFQNAYFASARQSENGKYHVYNVRVARVPIREVIVMGNFLSEINPANKAMSVSVTNYANGESVGKIKTNKVGKYSFVFPQGGKYNYEVKIEGTEDIYKFVVELPFLDEFRPLKQKALHTSIDGQEIVKIINLFDEKVEGAEALMAEVIRKKASLEVNVRDFNLKEIDDQQERNKVLADLGFNNMSIREVSSQLEELAITEKLNRNKAALIESNIDAEIIEKDKLIDVYSTQLTDIYNRIEETEEPTEKYELLSEALLIESERVQLAKEINNLDILKNQALSSVDTETANGKIQTLENQFNALIASEKEEEALALLAENKEVILKTKNESPKILVDKLIKESIATTKKVENLKEQKTGYEKTITELEAQIMLLTNSLSVAKKKEAQKIKNTINLKKDELKVVKELSDDSQKSIDENNKALNLLDNNIASMQKAMLNEDTQEVSNSEVEQVVSEVEAILRDDKTEKIEAELLAIEKSNLDLNPTNTTEINDTSKVVDATENPLLANKSEGIEKANDEKAGEIESNNNLSELEKNEQLLSNNTSTVQAIDSRVEEINNELNKNSSNQTLKEELADLNELKDEILEENTELNEVITELSSTAINIQPEIALSPEDVFKEVVSDYQEQTNKINEDSQLSELEKLKQIQSLDNEALKDIEEEQLKVKKAIAKDSENLALIARREILTDLSEQKQLELDERAQFINALDASSSIVDNSTIQSELEYKILKNLEAKKEEIMKGDDSDFEKSKKVIALNQGYVDDILMEKESIEKAIERVDDNTLLKQQLSVLTDMETEQKEAIIKEKRRAVASISAGELELILASVDKNYSSNVEEIKLANSVTMNDELANREVVLQDNLIEAIVAKEKQLKRKYSVTVELDKAIYEKALEESKAKEAELRSITSVVAKATTKDDFLQELRTALLKGEDDELTAEYSTKKELAAQEKILATYENQLTRKIEAIGSENELEKEQLAWLENELSAVKEKRRQIGITLGELQTEIASTNNSNKTNGTTFEKTQDQNKELNSELEVLDKNGGSSISIAKAKEFNESKTIEIEGLIKQADKAKSVKEKEYYLSKAQTEQDEVNSALALAISNEKRRQIEETENVQLLSQSELQKQKRRFTVQIGELTTEIQQVDEEIKSAKRRDIPKLETRKSQLIKERSLLETMLRGVEERLLKEDPIVSVVSKTAVNTEMSFNEERKQAGTEDYKKYYTLGTDALETERQILNLEKELKEQRVNVNQLLSENSPMNAESINLLVERIKTLTAATDRLKLELTQKKYLADSALPINTTEAMRMQNLVYRGIKPLKTVAVAALLQMPANGFTMNTAIESTYSEANPIPVNVESPSGLVYRVQIGAFARPIPQNLYKEFTPVSGEKIEGTNVTRYMAGYFNNSSAVVDARRDIRALGYSDAFIVAYCDGKRIGFGDARRREAAGTCVPKGSNELMLEVATKTAENLGLPTTSKVQEVPEFTYNQSPGATDAEPIEMMQGLFYTVQIGVFNRPVSDAVVYNLPELTTVRLSNGQIRYNTGIFNSVKEALPRRKDALGRGIVGAFIVAYYKGKRIPLAQAKHILSENGDAVLQSKMKKEVDIEINTKVVRTDSVTTENITPIVEAEVSTNDRIQIVSKKQFDKFPRDVLNRYNAEGAFFYDAKDKHVKSIIYKNADDLPRLWNFKDDIDTVYIPFSDLQGFETTILSIYIEGAVIPGDLMDWLLRFSYPREFIEQDSTIELRIYEVEKENIEKIQEQITTFGLTAVLLDETKIELEENE